MLNKAELEKLMVEAGHAINVNNGSCELIENVLCKTTTLCVEALNMVDPAGIPALRRDWRVGQKVKTKYRDDPLREVGEVVQVLPSGVGGMVDPAGILAVRFDGEIILRPADQLVTA